MNVFVLKTKGKVGTKVQVWRKVQVWVRHLVAEKGQKEK